MAGQIEGAQVNKLEQLKALAAQLGTGQISMSDVKELLEGFTTRTQLPALPNQIVSIVPDITAPGSNASAANVGGMAAAYRMMVRATNDAAASARGAVTDQSQAALLEVGHALATQSDAAMAQATQHAFVELMKANTDARQIVQDLIKATGAEEDANKLAALRMRVFEGYARLLEERMTGQTETLDYKRRWDAHTREILDQQFEVIKTIVAEVFSRLKTTLTEEADIGASIQAEERRRRIAVLDLWKDEFNRRLTQHKAEIELREKTIFAFRQAREEARAEQDKLETSMVTQRREWRASITGDETLERFIDELIAAGKAAQLDIELDVPTPGKLENARRRRRNAKVVVAQ